LSQAGTISTSGGGGGGVTSVTGLNGVTASPTTGAVVVSGVDATTSTVGVASFNPADFTVTSGEVSLLGSAFVSSVQGTAPIQINGVSGTPETGAVIVSVTDATTSALGVASFNSADFTVTAGAVSLLNGPGVGSVTAGTNINLTGTAANPIINLNDPVLLQNGSASAPSYSFANSTNSGMYYGNGAVILANGGEAVLFSYGGNPAAVVVGGSVNANLFLNGGLGIDTLTQSSNYAYSQLYPTYIGCSAGGITITLPYIQYNHQEGAIIIIKDESGAAATNPITITSPDSSPIDGNTNFIIDSNYGSVTLVSRSTFWSVV
jgi:hypothetical protein